MLALFCSWVDSNFSLTCVYASWSGCLQLFLFLQTAGGLIWLINFFSQADKLIYEVTAELLARITAICSLRCNCRHEMDAKCVFLNVLTSLNMPDFSLAITQCHRWWNESIRGFEVNQISLLWVSQKCSKIQIHADDGPNAPGTELWNF